jgi:hypothetical protein
MLSNSRFYYGISRKSVIAFGSLFNNLFIQRTDNTTKKIVQSINVPLVYSPKQKFMAEINAVKDKEDRAFQMELPKIAFEIIGYRYNVEAKLKSNASPNKYQIRPVNAADASIGIPSPTANQLTSAYPPVPYTLTFQVTLAAKNQDDMLQMFEQIVPFFNPTHSIPVKWIPELNVVQDMPITLVSVKPDDSYEGVMNDRRAIIWTLTFDANVSYYGPSTAANVIKKVDVNMYSDLNKAVADWDVHYHVEVNPLTASATDNYSFIEMYDEKL